MAEEGRRPAARRSARAQHAAVGQHDLEAHHRVGGAAVPPAAPEQRVLRQGAAHRGAQAGEGAPERCAQAAGFERFVQGLPRAASLHPDVHILGVNLQDLTHGGHVQAEGALVGADVSPAVGHPAASGRNHEVMLRCEAHRGDQIADVGGANHRANRVRIAGNVLAVQCPGGVVDQQALGADLRSQWGQGGWKVAHQQTPACWARMDPHKVRVHIMCGGAIDCMVS